MLGQAQKYVHQHCYTTTCGSCVPVLSNSEGGCSPVDPAVYQEASVLHRRWRKRCQHDPGCRRWSVIQYHALYELGSSEGIFWTGVGIVGKEGKQASLAADFSINQFSHLTKLLLWHGRNSYKRSAKLAQFVIHRGLIISTIQAVFSSIFFFARMSLPTVDLLHHP
jgi:hypothetical protein